MSLLSEGWKSSIYIGGRESEKSASLYIYLERETATVDALKKNLALEAADNILEVS